MGADKPAKCTIFGFDASKVLTDADVAQLFERLPPTHWEQKVLRSISYIDSIKKHDDPRLRSDGASQIFGECAIIESSGERHATIYRQHPMGNVDAHSFTHCVLHELGHAVYIQILSPQDQAEWAMLHFRSADHYNRQREADEHFCHQYAAYVLRPKFVRFRFPQFYPFLRRRVFGGKEY